VTRIRTHLRRLLVPGGDGPQLVAAAPGVRVRDIFRRFWPDVRPYRRWIALGLLFAIIVPATSTGAAWGTS
jgi:ATP-binding cassette, subfamily B, bacterial